VTAHVHVIWYRIKLFTPKRTTDK